MAQFLDHLSRDVLPGLVDRLVNPRASHVSHAVFKAM